MRSMFPIVRFAAIPVLSFVCFTAAAQPAAEDKGCKPPINRALFHDFIDKEQRNILRMDGKPDDLLYASDNETITYLVSNALTHTVNNLQCKIEADSLIKDRSKVVYLRGLEKILKTFGNGYKQQTMHASYLPEVMEAYEAAINKDKAGQSIEPIIAKKGYEVANLVVSSGAFDENIGFRATRLTMLRKFSQVYPNRILTMLAQRENADLPFRDSLIAVAAYKHPSQLYNYASANNRLGNAIRGHKDSLVQTIARMATSGGSGQMYFPFLDAILRGEISLAQIDAIKNDDVRYFKLLVKTRMDYMDRVRNKQSVRGLEDLTSRLEYKAREVFVKEINALHNEPAPVRFRILNQLSAQELYYVAVSSESEIYTSSYTAGVYPMIMQKVGNRGDSLLMSVGFDRFKKWIKLAAGFNTLSHFLKSFPKQDDTRSLMTAFVNGLERTDGLEDGVDVADSYVSISESDKQLADFVLALTKKNYEASLAQNNQRGKIIYNLLHKLFLSADPSSDINLSKEFGIPPVYNVAYEALAADSSQQVVMQMFFYGDRDGQNDFRSYLAQFNSGNWKITNEKQWVTISSTKGKPVTIFANRPLAEETGQDEEAQRAMIAYMDSKGLEPTIVIHRGHSYYAPYTIQHIRPSAKIVFLGSCGGYHLIHNVLQHSPNAHIIASKQIGKTIINQPFFNLLNEKLRNGNSIDWIPFWKEFGQVVTDKEGFQDYIPPHKNLGAIFIKAYNTQMGEAAASEG